MPAESHPATQVMCAWIAVKACGSQGLIEVDDFEWSKAKGFFLVSVAFLASIFANIKVPRRHELTLRDGCLRRFCSSAAAAEHPAPRGGSGLQMPPPPPLTRRAASAESPVCFARRRFNTPTLRRLSSSERRRPSSSPSLTGALSVSQRARKPRLKALARGSSG